MVRWEHWWQVAYYDLDAKKWMVEVGQEAPKTLQEELRYVGSKG